MSQRDCCKRRLPGGDRLNTLLTHPAGKARLLALLLLVALPSTALGANAIKLSGFWFDNVDILAFEEGKIVYVTSTGSETRAEITNIEGLRLSEYPQIEKALDLLDENKHKAAGDLFAEVAGKAREPWLHQYANWHLMQARDKQGDTIGAVQAYLKLVELNADPHFLDTPPLDSLEEAEAADLRRLLTMIRPIHREAEGETKQWLGRMVELAEQRIEDSINDVPRPAGDGDGNGEGESTMRGGERPSTSRDAGASELVLPRTVRIEQEKIVTDLEKGRFKDALRRAERSFARKERYAEKLYLMGLAQLQLAEQSGREADFKDAALSFMRVDVHYPLDPIRDFALVEVAYCHAQFDRPDIARKLIEEVSERGRITEENNPAYHQRMQAIAAKAGAEAGR